MTRADLYICQHVGLTVDPCGCCHEPEPGECRYLYAYDGCSCYTACTTRSALRGTP